MRLVEPRALRWTREEYHRMAELGFFSGRRVERIKGEVIEMSPQDSAHTTGICLLDYALKAIFGLGFVVRIQSPLSLGQESDPEPDVCVVRGSPRDFARSQPSEAALVVEVAGSSLQYDRTTKASLYAEAGIADYWVLNLVDRQLEVHREPRRDPEQPFGHGYARRVLLPEGGEVSPLALPGLRIRLADLLP